MLKTDLLRFLWGTVSLSLLCLSSTSQTQAQVVPDRTLPVNSAVTVDGSSTTISGGTTMGSNLFHSFEQFSVTTNGTVFFDNALEIQNILTRVTGGSISTIDGLIQANGSANLFLLNPNGIIFGPNASLNIGGSFLASTASSLVFADGNFSATDPNNTPLLSVNVPLGVQFGASANAIVNQSTVTDSNSVTVGLQVNEGETLALLGGDLNLEGGHLNAPSGRIELGSVAPNSQVNLTVNDTGLVLGYEGVQNFQDIELSQQAVASTRSRGGGDIQIQARELSVRDGSRVSASTLGDRPAGNITVTATELVEVSGAAIDNQNQFIFSTLAATSLETGDSGDLEIQTRQLITRDGADISVSAFGDGGSGNLNITATDSIELIGAGASPDGSNFSRSGLFAATEGTGNGGNLTVNTSQLIVRDGARISVSTRGPGRDGIPGGRGGNLIINASESIELSGEFISTDGRVFPSGLFALSGEVIPTIPETAATGDGGNLNVTTNRLTVRDRAEVSVNAQGSGAAGNLTIDAGSIRLDNGSIAGATASGSGGNVTLRISDSLQLRRNSEISTTAGETGNGGELKIDANIIAAIENSRITANADEGTGGNIQISARRGLFQAPDSDITASSQLGIDGSIALNTPDIETSQELVDLPEAVTDPAEQVARACQKDQEGSTFAIAGRGGLPPRPSEPLSSEALVGFDSVSPSAENVETRNFASIPQSDEVVLAPPARGWFVNDRGELVLTSEPLNVMSQRTSFSGVNCDAP